MRTVRHRVFAVQARLRREVTTGDPSSTLDERDCLSSLQVWLRKRGTPEDIIEAQRSSLLFPLAAGTTSLGPSPHSPRLALKNADVPDVKPFVSRHEARGKCTLGYYIANIKGRRVLHRLPGCYRVPGFDYLNFHFAGATKPRAAMYHAFCQTCQKASVHQAFKGAQCGGT